MDERRLVCGRIHTPKSLTESFQQVGRGHRYKTMKAKPVFIDYDVNNMYMHHHMPQDIMDSISKTASEHIQKLIEEQREALIKGLGIKAEYFTRTVDRKKQTVDTSLLTLQDITW